MHENDFLQPRNILTKRLLLLFAVVVVLFSQARAECKEGTYGENCSKSCSWNCVGFKCDINGTCYGGCTRGFKGNKCDTECDSHTYGHNCSRPCSPNCGGVYKLCFPINGACANGCASGFFGLRCRTECLHGFWGENCFKTCNENCAGGVCNRVTGRCYGCKPGRVMPWCDKDCLNGTWGLNCSETCPDCKELHCDTVNGTCVSEYHFGGNSHSLVQEKTISILPHIVIMCVCVSATVASVVLVTYLTRRASELRAEMKKPCESSQRDEQTVDDDFQQRLRDEEATPWSSTENDSTSQESDKSRSTNNTLSVSPRTDPENISITEWQNAY